MASKPKDDNHNKCSFPTSLYLEQETGFHKKRASDAHVKIHFTCQQIPPPLYPVFILNILSDEIIFIRWPWNPQQDPCFLRTHSTPHTNVLPVTVLTAAASHGPETHWNLGHIGAADCVDLHYFAISLCWRDWLTVRADDLMVCAKSVLTIWQ